MAARVSMLGRLGPVNIQAIDAVRVSVPMTEPFRISSGVVERKEAILLRLRHAEAFGWGESSAMPGAFYSSDTPDSCEQQLRALLPRLAGRTWSMIAELNAELRAAELSPFVRVAVETAAWEMLARERSQSLRSLFGLVDAPVATGLAIGLYPTLEELHDALERYEVRRYRRLKIKIKRGQDIELVRAVRSWYGDIPLFVDANADYGYDDITLLRELDPFQLMMIEQPFPRADLEAAAALQHQVRTPICFDEGIETADDVHRAAMAGACRIVNVKLQRVGGFLEALRVIEACEQHGMPFWMGTMPELGIGSAQALVLATHPACRFPTDVEPSARWYLGDVLSPELTQQDGLLQLPPGPGLGFHVDENAVERYATARWSLSA
jgi:O-succinylbenzoate synthase